MTTNTAISEGRLEADKPENYTLTSIPDALKIGQALGSNKSTSTEYYIKGTVKSAPDSTYGNLYLVDENGNEIYVYGLYDSFGNRYDNMSNKPKAGDEIIICGVIKKYVKSNNTTIEIMNAVVIEIDS